MKRIVLMFAASFVPMGAIAQLYTENFDVDHTAQWTVNKGINPAGNLADIFFDYSTYGIPSAPGSGGTTRGLRLESNVTGGLFSGLSVSPTGKSFTGEYEVRAKAWLNFVGPAPVGGNGSTQAGGVGIGTAGVTPQWAGGTQDSVWFATTTDGNSASDWRAYSTAAPASYGSGNAVYFAPSTNASDPYYAGFGGATPPPAQTALFASQTGATMLGNIAFGWHDFIVNVSGGFVTWTVDTLPIARINLATVTQGGSNIHFNYFDTNATSTSNQNRLNFMVIDNVSVTAVPEPATIVVLGLAGAALLRRRRKVS
ncbi:MAG: PEP-CTERM sorting domain-containing protein [Chlorobia bacterium]|nr:PEP-CTERM sorting domain-containing protein [Fimbriimonadaceae bacterium]